MNFQAMYLNSQLCCVLENIFLKINLNYMCEYVCVCARHYIHFRNGSHRFVVMFNLNREHFVTAIVFFLIIVFLNHL